MFLGGMTSTLTEYRVVANLNERVMANFISWIRFVVYDGDLDRLFDQVVEDVKKAREKYKNDKDFKFGSIGDYVRQIDLHNEVRTWLKIKSIVEMALGKYPTTLYEDIQFLATDTQLTTNTRNCLLLRIGEKKILHFLLSTANHLVAMSDLKKEQAVSYMLKNHKSLKGSLQYVKQVFLPMMENQENGNGKRKEEL